MKEMSSRGWARTNVRISYVAFPTILINYYYYYDWNQRDKEEKAVEINTQGIMHIN